MIQLWVSDGATAAHVPNTEGGLMGARISQVPAARSARIRIYHSGVRPDRLLEVRGSQARYVGICIMYCSGFGCVDFIFFSMDDVAGVHQTLMALCQMSNCIGQPETSSEKLHVAGVQFMQNPPLKVLHTSSYLLLLLEFKFSELIITRDASSNCEEVE